MGYTKDVIKGVFWVSAFRIFTRVFSLLKIIILARLLTPSQFGIFAIASLTLGFIELLTETGVNVFLVQSKRAIEEHIDSAWVVSIARGIIITLLLIILSPLIATFFKIPSALSVLLLVSTVPLIRGFINPSIVSLQKDLKFNYEFLFNGSVFVFDSLISIILAVITHSVFSFVWGLLAGVILQLILSFIFIKPTPKFKLNRNYINEIFHKGKWVTAYGIFNYIGEQGDNVAVGRLLGSASLGIYQLAYKISYLPISEISDVVNRVIFPVYTRIESDRLRLVNAFKRTTFLISILVIPISLFIFLFSSQIVSLLLGEKWIQAVPVLKVLSFYGIIRAVYGPSTALFLALGKQKYITAMTFVRFLGLALTIIPLVSVYGIIGASYSALFSTLIEIPLIVYFLYSILKQK